MTTIYNTTLGKLSNGYYQIGNFKHQDLLLTDLQKAIITGDSVMEARITIYLDSRGFHSGMTEPIK